MRSKFKKKDDYKYHEGGYYIHPYGRAQYIAGEYGRKVFHSLGEERCMSCSGYDLIKGQFLKKKE